MTDPDVDLQRKKRGAAATGVRTDDDLLRRRAEARALIVAINARDAKRGRGE